MTPDHTSRAVPMAEPDLRACVRDLVALSAMPAWWIGRSLRAIAESVCDLLLGMLHADAAYVQVQNSGSDPVVAVRGDLQAEVAAALEHVAPTKVAVLVPGHPDGGLRLTGFLIGRDGELGRIVAGSSRSDFPNDAESLLLEVAANQLAVALPYAALLLRRGEGEQLLRVRAAQQAAVAELGLRALSGGRIEQLIDHALRLVSETLQVDLGEVLELAPDGQSLLLRAGIGWGPGVVGHARVTAGSGSQAGYTLHVREPVVVGDLRDERRFAAPALLLEHGAISGITAIIHDDRAPYGILGAHARERRTFTPDNAHFLQSIANLLAAALQRHRAEAEREALLRQMGRAVAARDRAVGIVSHDLGNPLSTIQICATALLDPEPPSHTGMRHMAQIIQRSAAWMQQIVQDLLDRASLDGGRLVLNRQPTVASEVIGAAQVIFAPVAAEQELEFVVESTPGLPPVDADPRRLLQVLSNLLSNAIKFTPPGGRVVVSARAAEPDAPGPHLGGTRAGAVRFEVSDTGLGIAPEDLAHVFDWFWHSEREGRTGTGLGLAIAGGLVEAHHGRLHVESTPGQGSTFWFTMPATVTAPPAGAAS